MRNRFALWAFVVASLALTCWGVWSYVFPVTQCRGVEMGPGDVCHYSSTTMTETDRTQTYEQRIATVRQQVPFVVGAGAVATVFGIVLTVRSGKQGHGAVDDPVLLHEGDLGDAVADEVVVEE